MIWFSNQTPELYDENLMEQLETLYKFSLFNYKEKPLLLRIAV
ncbi:hypothetical protein HMPREF9189_0577 [Streptococcus sp. oral taxon 071 str. 73H25AP]|nr:hypothetical protein HMPREF9189_0577 [Streptococcus sp. oral taxon 071 str. 73H25AP]